MKTQKFPIHRQYPIPCKLFTSDDSIVKHVIIGVHGFAGDKDSSMLRKLALSCIDSNTALLCFDFPCHGQSPVNEEQLTIANCIDNLMAVIDYVTRQYPNARKSIFATSFGGYITLLSAQNLSDFTLVLRAPAVTMPQILLNSILHVSAEEFEAAQVMQCGFERKMNLPYSFYSDLTAQANPCDLPLAVPTLVIHGDCDDIVPLTDVLQFTNAQNSASIQIIAGADHRFKRKGEMEHIIAYTKDFLNV